MLGAASHGQARQASGQTSTHGLLYKPFGKRPTSRAHASHSVRNHCETIRAAYTPKNGTFHSKSSLCIIFFKNRKTNVEIQVNRCDCGVSFLLWASINTPSTLTRQLHKRKKRLTECGVISDPRFSYVSLAPF